MRLIGLIVVCCGAGSAWGQGRNDLPPLTLPPLASVEPAGGAIPDGTPVSRPLQPVAGQAVPSEPPPVVDEPPPEPTVAGPLPSSWGRYDLLFWWAKAQPLPPLVTGSRVGGNPVLGGPNTVVLVGGRALDSQDSAGARFTWGWNIATDHTFGLEISYLFLGSRTYARRFADYDPGNPFPTIGRPILNAAGQEDVVLVSSPGARSGQVVVSHSTRVTGWEVNGVASVYAGDTASVRAIGGYRYFMANEGLQVSQASIQLPTAGTPAVFANTADQIDAHNRFHGGQLGLTADACRGGAFVELTAKVGLGKVVEVVRVSGQTFFAPGIGTNAGLLGVPATSGRSVRTAFAVLPEGEIKLGYRFNPGAQVYVGYSVIYLNEAVRPGEQVDRTAAAQTNALLPGPGPAVTRGEFWVQGLTVGVEYRY